MFDPTYPLFPIFAFIGFISALVPLSWHFQAWNSGTCFYMFWASLACLNQFINSVVWADNAINSAPIWCDISIRIMLGASVGLPAASLCINRRLYHIASVQSVSIGRAEKRRAILIDTLICILFPMIFVAVQYVVQGHRFDIFEGIGCYPAIFNTLPAYLLSGMWPILIGLVSAVYCILSLRSFARRRVEFGQFLASNKSLTVSRYFRLMALAMTEIIFTTPLAAFTMWLNATATPIAPWLGWEDAHFNFSRVEQIPALIWRSSNRPTVAAMELSRWVTPLCALVFFGFFGFADEAKRNYRAAFWRIMKPFGFLPTTARHADKASSNIYTPKVIPVKIPLSSLPSYSPPPSASTFATDFKRPDSLTPSFSDTYDATSTQLPTPPSVSTTFSLPRRSIDTLTPSTHDHHDSENMYYKTSAPSSRRSSISVHEHEAGPFASR
ncbi:pheromone receptor Rcb2 B44 [Lyophyllum atratum]|nr:pheromone receptor Rcb2 B44 [Lyophyllum atratum]KAF8063935.1 pheromone receptor Rcb2 B44 [Lyophyllum atratum]